MSLRTPVKQLALGVLLLVSLLVAGGTAAHAAGPQFTLVDLGTLGGPSSSVDTNLGRHVMNDAGQVVGTSSTTLGSRAFLWTPSVGMTNLGTLGGVSSSAAGINESGQVVGSSATTNGTTHAFVWSPGSGMTDLGGLTSFATAISDTGFVVGQAATTVGDPSRHAFLWTPADGMTDLGTLGGTTSSATAVNDDGQVVGSSYTIDGRQHAFSWTRAGGMVDLTPDAIGDTFAYAVNESGVVAGTTGFSFGPMAFVWTVDAGLRGVGGSAAYALNEQGDVAGFSYQGAGTTHPFMFLHAGLGLQLDAGINGWAYALNDGAQAVGTTRPMPGLPNPQAFSWTESGGVMLLPMPSGYSTSTAVGVNNHGQVVGNAFATPRVHAFVWLPASDTTAPVVSVPADVTAEATSAAGAVIVFGASAHDDVDGAISPTCSRATGATFPLGETLVTCTATDAAGNTGSASFTVRVRDTTPPALDAPEGVAVDATGPAGAEAVYTATATDLVDASPVVVCEPPSGMTFAIGDTLVRCTAADAARNTVSGTFLVHVRGAAEQLTRLADAVADVGPGTSLPDKVGEARTALAAGDSGTTRAVLRAFAQELTAQAGKRIAASAAEALVADAARICVVLGG